MEKNQNSHFWPFQIDTSLFGKNCWKKIRMQPFLAIPNLYQSLWEKLFKKIWKSHFWPFQIYSSLLGKIIGKKLEQPFLAIPNLYQSFWEKLLKKIWNSHFWPFQIYTSLFGKNCWKKFRTAIFGHSKFIPVSLGKLLEKFQSPNLGKIVGKNLEWPFLAIPNLYQSFWEKLLEKNQNSHFWPFQIYTSLLGKIVGKNLEEPFLAIPN